MTGHNAATAPRWREGRAESSARAGRSAVPCPKSRAFEIRGGRPLQGACRGGGRRVPPQPRGCGHVRLLADVERDAPPEPPAVVVLDDPAPEPWRPHRDQLGSQP